MFWCSLVGADRPPNCCCCFSHSAHWLPARKKLLYTVANPARGLLNRGKKKKKKSGSVTRSHTSSHPIVELSDSCYHLRWWYSDASEYLPQEGAVNGVVSFLGAYETHMRRDTPAFRPTSCSLRTTNIMSMVERSGRNPHCSSGNSPFASQ